MITMSSVMYSDDANSMLQSGLCGLGWVLSARRYMYMLKENSTSTLCFIHDRWHTISIYYILERSSAQVEDRIPNAATVKLQETTVSILRVLLYRGH